MEMIRMRGISFMDCDARAVLLVADMVADMEVDKVAGMFADIVAKKGTYFGKKKKGTQFGKKKKRGTQFGEKVGHRGWLIGPKLFRPEPYPTCVSSKLCKSIFASHHDNRVKLNV